MKTLLTYFSKGSWIEQEVNVVELVDDELYKCVDTEGNLIGYFPIENIDLLTTCGTFCVKDCTTSEELCKLLKTKGEDV